METLRLSCRVRVLGRGLGGGRITEAHCRAEYWNTLGLQLPFTALHPHPPCQTNSGDLISFFACSLCCVALSGVANLAEYFDMRFNNLTESGKQKLRVAADNLPKLTTTYGFDEEEEEQAAL